jgi:hypothetical protein
VVLVLPIVVFLYYLQQVWYCSKELPSSSWSGWSRSILWSCSCWVSIPLSKALRL